MKRMLLIVLLTIFAITKPVLSLQESPVLTLTAHENGQAIVNLAQPQPFTQVEVEIDDPRASLEVISQIKPRGGERLIIVSQLDQLIITALTSRGVVGEPRKGGYELSDTRGEVAVIKISGTLLPGTKNACLIGIVSESRNNFTSLVDVRIQVKPPPGFVQFLGKIFIPWGIVFLSFGLVGFLAWMLLKKRRTVWEE